MKAIHGHHALVRNMPGSVRLVLEEDEDMWHAYNLIAAGDVLKARTNRKADMTTDQLRPRGFERVKLMLQVVAESVEHNKEGSTLRVHGRIIATDLDCVMLGQYHTLQLELNKPFELNKNNWDWLALDTLRQACALASTARLAVILMHEGHANLFLVGHSVTVTKAHIETPIPRKHGSSVAAYQTSLESFFERVLRAFLSHVNFEVVKCVVIASPGFTKDQFYDYLLLEAARQDLQAIIKNKSSIVLAHAHSGYKHSLNDVLDAPGVRLAVKDTMVAREVQALQDFHSMAAVDSARAVYGPMEVEMAHERFAIKSLLITEDLFRNVDVATRQKYVDLVESVKEANGMVYIFSSMHVSGQQLAQMTGIAAILRFPLPELDDETEMW